MVLEERVGKHRCCELANLEEQHSLVVAGATQELIRNLVHDVLALFSPSAVAQEDEQGVGRGFTTWNGSLWQNIRPHGNQADKSKGRSSEGTKPTAVCIRLKSTGKKM